MRKFPLASEPPTSSNCKLRAKHQKFAGEAPSLAQEPCDSATELRILSIKVNSKIRKWKYNLHTDSLNFDVKYTKNICDLY
jgi:hypothetical protein